MDLPASDVVSTLEKLQHEHRAADLRLTELTRRVWLSSDEQIELSRLKKQKLQLKDRMRSLGARG